MPHQTTKKVSETPLWKLAFRFMFSFGFLLTIVLVAAELIKTGNLNAITESFHNGQWLPFLGIRLSVIFIYGFAMAFMTKKRATKTTKYKY